MPRVALALLAAALGGALGAGSAGLGGGAGHVARAELQVGARFLDAPLEPLSVAAARLEGLAWAAEPGVAGVEVEPRGAGEGAGLHLGIETRTASTARVAAARAVKGMLEVMRRAHASELEGQRAVQARFRKVAQRLETLTATASARAAFAEQLELSEQRLQGTQLVLDRLAAHPPRTVSLEEGPAPVPYGARAALGALGGGLLALIGLLTARAGRRPGPIVLGAALGGALGLLQAGAAPPEVTGVATLRLPRLAEQPLPTDGPVAPGVERWLAFEVRQGRLPWGVRFRVAGPDGQGLLRLVATGSDPAAVRRVLEAAEAQVARLFAVSFPRARKVVIAEVAALRRRFEAELAAARDPAQVQAASDLVLELARAERAALAHRTTPTERLLGPVIRPTDVEGRRAPYLAFGIIAGALFALLGAALRARWSDR